MKQRGKVTEVEWVGVWRPNDRREYMFGTNVSQAGSANTGDFLEPLKFTLQYDWYSTTSDDDHSQCISQPLFLPPRQAETIGRPDHVGGLRS
jgi:hypothetical protein